MIKYLFSCLFIFSIYSCGLFEKKKTGSYSNDKNQIMETDRAFSRLSEEKGMKQAFLEYIDSNGVLLRPGHFPLMGADAIDYLIQQNDSTYSLKWEPKSGVVAESGEMGYTYGIYVLQPSIKDTLLYGTYVSIWKKQSDGNWKFVLDTGNEAIGEQQ